MFRTKDYGGMCLAILVSPPKKVNPSFRPRC